MNHKRPDLDPRGSPEQPHARIDLDLCRDGYTKYECSLLVPSELHQYFKEQCDLYDVQPNKVINRLYFAACEELGINTEPWAEQKEYRTHTWRRSTATVELRFSEVVLDECDMPGVAEPQELGTFDPYFHTFYGDIPNYGFEPGQRQSIQMLRLRQAVKRATESIERLSSLKRYTNVFVEGRITKAEAKAELEAILLMMPGEVKDALWGWCSVNDAINLCSKWQNVLKEEMDAQLKIENIRMEARRRYMFEKQVEHSIQTQKARMLDTYKRQKRVRPEHGAEWPTWAGQLESYLDYASDPAQQGENPAAWIGKIGKHNGREAAAIDHYVRESDGKLIIEKVHSKCTINLSEGLTHEIK